MQTIWNSDARHDRFDCVSGQQTMKAIVTEGNGGYEKLLCREVCLPVLKSGEVLVHVLAMGVNFALISLAFDDIMRDILFSFTGDFKRKGLFFVAKMVLKVNEYE